MQKILFVCTMNKLRSATAEGHFAATDPTIDVRSCGTASDAHVPMNAEDVSWADTIVCMEHAHAKKLRKRFKNEIKANVIILGIPDDYDYMDPGLIWLLEKKKHLFIRNSPRHEEMPSLNR